MNVAPGIDPVTAHSDGGVVHWLTNDTRDERFIDNIFAELCVRLQRSGIPVTRATLHVLVNHPQWLGARIMWAEGMREAEIARVDYDVAEAIRGHQRSRPTKSMTAPPRCANISNASPSLGRSRHAVYDEMRAKGSDRLMSRGRCISYAGHSGTS